jgi:histidinol dehydrogenase
MSRLTYPSPDFERMLLTEDARFKEIELTVGEILRQVRARGDEAIVEFARKFQKITMTPRDLRVSGKELASAKVDPSLAVALKGSLKNIQAFARKSLEKDWSMTNSHGARVGERFSPLKRVGIYVPGGTAPLVSTVLMTVGLAKTAGVPEIVVCTPPPVSDAILYALRLCGATEVFRAGGAQAVAAMAYGTDTIRPVAKILGPGNAYVTEAKRQLFGRVGIDLLAGPSEVMIIADKTAPLDWVAADLLAQAEHGQGSRVFLVSDDEKVFSYIEAELRSQMNSLWSPQDKKRQKRHILALEVFENTFYQICVRKFGLAAEVANRIAPEHLQIMARNAKALASKITTAGAIFLGPCSPTVLGDYVAGPSHTLPTGGAGRAFSGLRVQDFRRRTSIVEYNAASLKKAVHNLEAIANAEGLEAHARSARIRVSK